MMKKLLILALVLCLPGVASALYSAVAPVVAGPVTWDVINDQLVGTGTSTGVIYDGYLMGITNGTLIPDALSDGTMAGAWVAGGDMCNVGEPAAGMFTTFSQGVQTPQTLGKWFSFDISGFTNPMTVDIWGTSSGVTGTITIIPEPMTIALLGLGGLFLLRRRK